MSTEPTADELQQLESLLTTAKAVGHSATAFSGQRLSACVEVGRLLNAWKQRLPYGKWLKWASEYLPDDLCERTRRRWMTLALKVDDHKLDISSAKGLRQAYELADLLPERCGSSTKKPAHAKSYLVQIAHLTVTLQGIALDTLRDEDKATLKMRLNQIAEFIKKL